MIYLFGDWKITLFSVESCSVFASFSTIDHFVARNYYFVVSHEFASSIPSRSEWSSYLVPLGVATSGGEDEIRGTNEVITQVNATP